MAGGLARALAGRLNAPLLEGRITRLLVDLNRSAQHPRRFLEISSPELRIHMNQPYRGTSNGMGQQHRRHYPDGKLITFELELNQRLVAFPLWADIPITIARFVAGFRIS